uniref:Uncharacterized protein n=1 Tax=Nelumbo nucifera TaxID=4432 RepID=A0A822ZJE0_NELNU|nr:TPA_asm: hypothetical protein HUJ06_003237 [Nelumbo nucifera]
MLSCNIEGITNGFHLFDFSVEFLRNVFPKIEWKVLVDAARSMGYSQLPDEADSFMLDSDDFLKKFHHALLELHLLICPETGRHFPVKTEKPCQNLNNHSFWQPLNFYLKILLTVIKFQSVVGDVQLSID